MGNFAMKKFLLASYLLLATSPAMAGSFQITMGQNGFSEPRAFNLVGWNPVSLLVTFSQNASLTCGVQISNDGFNTRDSRGNPIPMTNWNNHDTLVNLVANANGNIYFPVVAVRLVVTNWVSGTCTLGAAQVGP